MSLRKLETNVVDCDTCDEVYADVVSLSRISIQALALRDGWRLNDDETHACPACVVAGKELALAQV